MCEMCGCGSKDAFMGVEMPNRSVYDIGPGQMETPIMFGTDSMNNLGVSKTEMDMN